MKKYTLAFDSGKETRYIDEMDERLGTSIRALAKQFDTEAEAQEFNDERGYLCWVEEIETVIYSVYDKEDTYADGECLESFKTEDEAHSFVNTENAGYGYAKLYFKEEEIN